MLSLVTIQSVLRIHRLPLHLLRQYCIIQVWNILSILHTLYYYPLSTPHSALIRHRLAMLLIPHPHPHRRHRRPQSRRHQSFPAQISRCEFQPILALRRKGWHHTHRFRHLHLRNPRCPLVSRNAVFHLGNCCLSGTSGRCFWSQAPQAPLWISISQWNWHCWHALLPRWWPWQAVNCLPVGSDVWL